MALEAFLYREAPEPGDINDLLNRAVFAAVRAFNDCEPEAEAYAAAVGPLVQALLAITRAEGKDREVVLVEKEEAEKLYSKAWCRVYNFKMDLKGEDAETFIPTGVPDLIYDTAIPRDVVITVARAMAEICAQWTKGWYAYCRERTEEGV